MTEAHVHAIVTMRLLAFHDELVRREQILPAPDAGAEPIADRSAEADIAR